MAYVHLKSFIKALLTIISVFLCFTSITEQTGSVSPVYDCGLYNDTYICTGSQYRMYCSRYAYDFYYTRSEHSCRYSGCSCYGDKKTCTCTGITSPSCSCDNYSNNITITTAVSPVYDCVLHNDTYICTRPQYRMNCNISTHFFYYSRYYHQCRNNDCDCRGNGFICRCYSNTSSSCFCMNFNDNTTVTTAVSPLYECGLYKDTYICTGSQYRMFCSRYAYDFYYTRSEHSCRYSDCRCYGDKKTCTCTGITSPSCSCDNYSNNITITTAVSPVYDCVLHNDTYICTRPQYRMNCNISTHFFYYSRYYHQCRNNDCDCRGNGFICRCYSNTSSSCFCMNYNDNTTVTTAVSPLYECGLYSDTYICTGAQYRMYCSKNAYEFYYTGSEHSCRYSGCSCYGDKKTCTCTGITSPSCSCDNYSNNITITTAVSPVYDCVLHNDTYICTRPQYRMNCNISTHFFYYSRYYHQCRNNDCDCRGNGFICRCYSNTSSSCFCMNFNDNTTVTTAVSPLYECGLYKDTYICTGSQYRMFCSRYAYDFYYTRSEHSCRYSDCRCYGDKKTCTCTGITSPSCSCDNYSNNITITTAVSPVYDCVLHNDTYICTGAQHRMYCNTTAHDFYYSYRNYIYPYYRCRSNKCNCYITSGGNCTCDYVASSSCFCDYNFTATTSTSSSTTTGVNTSMLKECTNEPTQGCAQNLLDQILNITDQVLHLDNVKDVLDVVFKTPEMTLNSSSEHELVKSGNRLLQASEKLVSMLVKPTNTNDSFNFTLDSLDAEGFMVGPDTTLDKIPLLDTTNASMDIDLIGIAKNNHETRSAAVVFMIYTTMEKLLKPSFFSTSNDTVKSMMSTVISATLPKTTNTKLTKAVNFTLKHIRASDPSGNLCCVYWKDTEWVVDGCSVLESNSSHTVCSCVHLSTFALIMQTKKQPAEDDQLMRLLGLVAVIVGLVFFTLSLLTFALCHWSPGVNNVARINICMSLLLAHLLFLLTQEFLKYIQPHQELCAVISGVLHFLFLSSFVWMFIEAVLLFICVKNLSQISSKQREVLSSGFMFVIGYVIALVMVGVSVGLVPEGYGSDSCWIKQENDFIWSFLGPVCVILALNTILFISITVSLNAALKKLNAEVSQMKQTKIMVFKTLAQCVVLGCPWFLGFFTSGNKMIEILFLILSSQQGTFIFVIHCVLNNEVREQYVRWLKGLFPGLKPSSIKSAPKKH